MGRVIELCRRCGFDIPADADECPGCGRDEVVVPPLAAQQVAGLALPTRSTHRLPTIPPEHDHLPQTIGPADGARSAFGYATLFLVITLTMAVLTWAARLERFVPSVPDGTVERLDGLIVLTTWASVIGMAIGVLAMFTWTVRRLRVGRRRRADRRRALSSLQPLPR